MDKKGATTYTLRYKGNIGGGTMRRLQNGETVSTHTLDLLCSLLRCKIEDVIEYVPDGENQ